MTDPQRTTKRAPSLQASGKRKSIFPLRLDGQYARLRKRIAIVLILIFFVAPWIEWGGRPLIRLDFMADIFWVGFMVWRRMDAFYFLAVPLLLVLILFLATAVRGRIWCGYACPQTVFLDWMIRPIEEWFEGSAYRQQNDARKKLTPKRLLNKIAKHLVFIFCAVLVGNTFLMYFFEPRVVLAWVLGSPLDHWVPFSVMFLISFVFYADFAWFREQFCSFVCPYARIQAILMDEQSPSVTYDVERGEPRTKKKGGGGDCIDCELCVRVCPTGIDIRDGLQLECIQCLRCVDACNTVMASLKREPDLIYFGTPEHPPRIGEPPLGWRSVLRGRVLLYSGLTVFLLATVLYGVGNRADLGIRILRQQGSAVVPVSKEMLANLFQVHLVNNSGEPIQLDLSTDHPDVTLICGSCREPVAPYQSQRASLVVHFPRSFSERSIEVCFQNESIRQCYPLRILSHAQPE